MAKYPNFGYRNMPNVPIAWIAVLAVLLVAQFNFLTAVILAIILTVIFFSSDDVDKTNKFAIPLGFIALIIAAIVKGLSG